MGRTFGQQCKGVTNDSPGNLEFFRQLALDQASAGTVDLLNYAITQRAYCEIYRCRGG
jgi:hypothetical protein